MARVVFLGVYVTDLAFWSDRLPRIGETVVGQDFRMGPGGKGSNQAVAAARAGAAVTLLTKLGTDTFGDVATHVYQMEGIDHRHIIRTDDQTTGAAFIMVHPDTGENAIIVSTGSGGAITVAEVDGWAEAIAQADLFVTNLEVPVPAVLRGLELARSAGVPTVLNPAPAVALPEAIYPLVDHFTPNETEAEALSGLPVGHEVEAVAAARLFRDRGVGHALLTLGEAGALLVGPDDEPVLIPPVSAGKVIDTTGAGDAFTGAYAVGLSEGLAAAAAARFACAAAGISVTRVGTAPSTANRAEIDRLLGRG